MEKLLSLDVVGTIVGRSTRRSIEVNDDMYLVDLGVRARTSCLLISQKRVHSREINTASSF